MKVDPELIKSVHREVGDRLQAEQVRRRTAVPVQEQLSGATEQQYARKLIADVVREHASKQMMRGLPPLELEVERELAEGVHARMYGAGRLQELLDDEAIENININGCDEVWIKRSGGRRVRGDAIASTDEELIELVQTLAAYAGLNSRPWDTANPELDLQLPDGSRLSGVMGVAARPSISIRRHRLAKVELSDLVGNDTLSDDAAEFLTAAVKARFNLMIAGATDAGKTTMLRACAAEIGAEERIITVEKALELGLRKNLNRHPNCVELEERMANSEGQGSVTMKELVRRSLRMDPDRVIVGEVLGPEVIDMLNAMGQGNDGSLSTIHARSARHVFERIATYAIQSAEQLPHEATGRLIAGGLDFVIFLSQQVGTGKRRLVTILEVDGFDDGVRANEIFQAPESGPAVWTGVMPSRMDRLAAAGWTNSQGQW